MERFFIVKEKSLIDAVKDYEYMRKHVNDAFGEFAKDNHIETTKYYQLVDQLMIIPTENDKIKFKGQLKADNHSFKKNSVMNEKWVEFCKDRGLRTPRKPSWELSKLIGLFTRFHCRLFSLNGVVYGSFEVDFDFVLPEEHFTELKASEFYKIIEEWKERNSND